jgi:hypothetical protein
MHDLLPSGLQLELRVRAMPRERRLRYSIVTSGSLNITIFAEASKRNSHRAVEVQKESAFLRTRGPFYGKVVSRTG